MRIKEKSCIYTLNLVKQFLVEGNEKYMYDKNEQSTS